MSGTWAGGKRAGVREPHGPSPSRLGVTPQRFVSAAGLTGEDQAKRAGNERRATGEAVGERDPGPARTEPLEPPGPGEGPEEPRPPGHFDSAGPRRVERDVLRLHAQADAGHAPGPDPDARLLGPVQEPRLLEEGVPVEPALVILRQVEQHAGLGGDLDRLAEHDHRPRVRIGGTPYRTVAGG